MGNGFRGENNRREKIVSVEGSLRSFVTRGFRKYLVLTEWKIPFAINVITIALDLDVAMVALFLSCVEICDGENGKTQEWVEACTFGEGEGLHPLDEYDPGAVLCCAVLTAGVTQLLFRLSKDQVCHFT